MINPRDINVYKLTVDKSANIEASVETLKAGDQIESEEMILEFNSADKKDCQMEFTIIEKSSMSEDQFQFALNYWPSYVNHNHW